MSRKLTPEERKELLDRILSEPLSGLTLLPRSHPERDIHEVVEAKQEAHPSYTHE